METDQVIISIKDLITIEWYLTDAIKQLEYLHMNQQTELIIHNIEKNLETAIDNIQIVTSNQWSSRNQIEAILLNIRNATYNTLKQLEEYSLIEF